MATSPGDYVRIAVEVARDPERNRALRGRIAERRGVLFDQDAPIAAFSEALLALGSGRH